MRFLDGDQVELSAAVALGSMDVIGSVKMEIEFVAGGIRFVPRAAAIGCLPLPIACVRSVIREMEGVDPKTCSFPIARRGVWPNGRRSFEVSALKVSSGRLRVVLKPLAP
ncbi:MAG: hypothetical protein JNG88_04580 [Phycisphaerales bacterium]|nr:hypothetical protein [Phycisphaerales bacterium]